MKCRIMLMSYQKVKFPRLPSLTHTLISIFFIFHSLIDDTICTCIMSVIVLV